MKLSQPDVDLFYGLLDALQFFAKSKLNLLKDVKTLEAYAECSPEEQLPVRNLIYEDTSLIDAFVKENPNGFSEENLHIVSQWKHFVADNFVIERLLKQYGVFISSTNEVYAVHGLRSDFGEMIPKSRLPMYVKAVLLPFKGRIVYDGIFNTYNVFIGGTMSGNFKNTYLKAKQNGRIIETLEPGSKSKVSAKGKPKAKAKDFSKELDQLSKLAQTLKGGASQPAIYGPAFSLIKSSIELGQAAIKTPDDADSLRDKYNKALRALKKAYNVLNRMD